MMKTHWVSSDDGENILSLLQLQFSHLVKEKSF